MRKTFRIADFLHRKRVPIKLEPQAEYSLVTIKVRHKGVVLREKKPGHMIKSNMYRVSAGDFILSGIDARHGAFGIVPDELDGAIVTNDFWYFDVDERIIKRDFFYWLTNTPLFLDACIKSSKGETQRVRLQKSLFFDFTFTLPPIEEQESFLKRIQVTERLLSELNNEIKSQTQLLQKLRQAILQEAIEGKLTAYWREQNPVQKGNPDFDANALLEQIKAEKKKLIAGGKLKKDKPLEPIQSKEVPFDFPQGWVLCRLNEVSKTLSTGPFGSMLHKSDYVKSGIPVINPTNIKNNSICVDGCMMISEETHARLTRYSLVEGDMVIARRGNLQKCAIVGLQQVGWLCGTGSFFMRTIGINERFLQLFYTSSHAQNYLLSDCIGQTMDNLNQTLLMKLPLPLPSLAEQREIVERVKNLMVIVDGLEGQVLERKAQTDRLIQAVLREVFG